jgi:hypothetical protein
MFLPQKKSINWSYVLLIVFASNVLALLGSEFLLSSSISLQNAFGFSIISLIVSLIVSSGYFGIRFFSLSVIVSNVIAIIYIYYIILSKSSPGWADLVGLISYMLLIGLGIILGTIVQTVFWIISRRKLK